MSGFRGLFVAYTINMTFLCFQLQEAFAKGLLKPGMNVCVDKSKRYVNNVVSDRVKFVCWRALWFTQFFFLTKQWR